jgi:hypothetical protein
MLYSGHFSFDEITPSGMERHGYFTCLVKAGTPELALQNFKQRIQIIKEDIKAYQWVPESDFSTDQKEANGEYQEAIPFLRF